MKKYILTLLVCSLLMSTDSIDAKERSANLTSIDVINQSLQANIEFIHVYFTALSGNFHQVIIPAAQLESALLNGLKFDGSSVPGCSNIFDSDMHLALDFDSFFVNPKIKNQPKTARIFACVYQDEVTPYPADGRYLLKQAMQSAHDQGYEFYVGPEIEFFLLEKNKENQLIPFDNGYYFGVELNQKHETIKYEMIQTLLEHGVIIEKFHHEVPAGKHEFSIKYSTPLQICDQIMIAKHVVKEIAGNYSLIATFMPKPFFGISGSGMHIHLSVADYATDQNLFFDNHGDAFLSRFAHRCIAGILNRIVDGSVIFNSTINSCKRLFPYYQTPVYLGWAKNNRSAIIRIPQVNRNQPYAVRAEFRIADGLCNPYLLLTFLLQSCLAGIAQQELLSPAFSERNIVYLPTSLTKAIERFAQSSTMLKMFNQTLIKEFVTLTSKEIMQFSQAVTDWELEKYL